MKRSHYAKQMSVTYKTAYGWWKKGLLDAYQTPTGTMVVREEKLLPTRYGPSHHEALPQVKAIPLNNAILRRMEIEFGCAHKAHALIHLHGRLHHIGCVQSQRWSASTFCPLHTLTCQCGSNPLSAHRRNYCQQPHLWESGTLGSLRPIRACRWWVEQHTAHDFPRVLRHNLLGW